MKSRLSKENDYVNDSVFRKFIAEKLTEIADFRQKIIDDSTSFNKRRGLSSEIKMLRNPYTHLREHNMLNADTLLLECVKIMRLESTLPSAVRRFLGGIYHECMDKTIEFYKK